MNQTPIEQAFNEFALLASKARFAEADEFLKDQAHRIEHPDLTVIDVLRNAGVTVDTPMHKLLEVLVDVPEARGLFDEWMTYRWTLRTDPEVHRIFFRSIEPGQLFPGNFTDHCFIHATLDNLYQNQLWDSCRSKPPKQKRLCDLADALRRKGTPTKNKKKIAPRLNDDSGLLRIDTVESQLTIDRTDTATILKTMRQHWEAASHELTALRAKLAPCIDTTQLRAILAQCQRDLVSLQECRSSKDQIYKAAVDEFNATSLAPMRALLRAITTEPTADDTTSIIKAAKIDNNTALSHLRDSVFAEEDHADAMEDAALAVMRRNYIIESRVILRKTFESFSNEARLLTNQGNDIPTLHAVLLTVQVQSGKMAIAIKHVPDAPIEPNTQALADFIQWHMRKSAREFVASTFSIPLPKQNDITVAQLNAAITLRLRNAIDMIEKGHVLKGIFSPGMTFINKHVEKAVLADVDAISVLEDKRSAGQLLEMFTDQLTTKVEPRLARLAQECETKLAPVVKMGDMAAGGGEWRVDMALFRQFISDHVEPQIAAIPTPCSDVQSTLWLADAIQLTKMITPPTFIRVFQAIRALQQVHLLLLLRA